MSMPSFTPAQWALLLDLSDRDQPIYDQRSMRTANTLVGAGCAVWVKDRWRTLAITDAGRDALLVWKAT